MITKRRVIHLSFTLLTALFLSACGGGSSGDSSKEVTIPKIDIKGSVSSGLIELANVKVWHVVDKVIPAKSSYSAITNKMGEFSFVHTGKNQGLLYIEISGDPDSTSLLTCYLLHCGESLGSKLDTNTNGLVDFGEQMVMPETLVLKAWVSAPFSKSLNINLATHIVASQFTQVPTLAQLQELNDEAKVIYGLSTDVDKLSIFDAQTGGDISEISDHITLLSLLETTDQIDFLAAINRLTESFKEDNKDQQLVVQSANAIKIAERLLLLNDNSEQAQAIVENLQVKNKAIAKEKNMLTADELPILLPEF